MDRRAVFFLGAAAACFAVAPVGLEKYQHIALIVGTAYVVFAVLSFLDARSRARAAARRRR
jgi:hypothetical protein